MRIFFLLLAIFNPSVLLSQSAERLLENGIVRASMPFENAEYVGFRLLIEYNKELYVCYFKVLSDYHELQTCEKLIE
jgi:hypothetical protein